MQCIALPVKVCARTVEYRENGPGCQHIYEPTTKWSAYLKATHRTSYRTLVIEAWDMKRGAPGSSRASRVTSPRSRKADAIPVVQYIVHLQELCSIEQPWALHLEPVVASGESSSEISLRRTCSIGA